MDRYGRDCLMYYQSDCIVLRSVTEEDIPEIARTWPSNQRPLSSDAAKHEYDCMRENYETNAHGMVRHLCLAVCETKSPEIIIGWCGLAGHNDPNEPEIFVLLNKEYQNLGYGTACMKMLLLEVAKDMGIRSVHGGCRKNNIASKRAMEKAGMKHYGDELNGDPLYRYKAK